MHSMHHIACPTCDLALVEGSQDCHTQINLAPVSRVASACRGRPIWCWCVASVGGGIACSVQHAIHGIQGTTNATTHGSDTHAVSANPISCARCRLPVCPLPLARCPLPLARCPLPLARVILVRCRRCHDEVPLCKLYTQLDRLDPHDLHSCFVPNAPRLMLCTSSVAYRIMHRL
jgi:hypothetical protein